MKILKKIAAISLVTMCFLSNSVFAEVKEINTATRVRKEATTESKILVVLYPGNDVEVLGQDGEWSKIKRGDIIGYVKTEFLKKLEDKDDESEIYNTTKNEIKNVVKNETISNKVENKVENKVSNTVKNEVQNTTVKEEPIVKEEYENLPEGKVAILIKTDSSLLPNFFSKNIEELDAGKVLEIVDEINNWYKVKSDSGKEGWILKAKTTNKVLKVVDEEMKTENKIESKQDKVEDTKTSVREESKEETLNKKGTINVETANVREKATTSSKKINTLDQGDEVTILSEESGFYKIKFGDVSGYVSKTLITLKDDKVSTRSLSEERKEEQEEIEAKEEVKVQNEVEEETEIISINAQEVVNYAKQYVGIKYVLGGKSPETGFDCAGFTKYVYKNFGYTLGSIASAQDSVGTDVNRDELQSGDLLLFLNEEKTKIGHTGVYIGNGDFVHAANPERGVVIDNLNTMSYYDTRFVKAKRIVE